MTDIMDRLLEKRQITETRKHRDFDVNGQTNSVYREELFNPDGLEAVQEIERLKAIASKAIREQIPMREEIERLRQAMHDIYEVYAGSEGFIPETCAEAYLQDRIKEMAYIAGKHKRGDGRE